MTGNPIFWTGDLNVAHASFDCYNDGAKHLAKQAGLTPEERASFAEQLGDGFVDGFRYMYPEAKGHYTYWSQRAGNRAPNKGLRLDYFICEESMVNSGPGKKAALARAPRLPIEHPTPDISRVNIAAANARRIFFARRSPASGHVHGPGADGLRPRLHRRRF